MTSKKERKHLHIDFGRYFFQIKAHQAILGTLSHHFAQISTGFKAFCKIKTFGVGIVPPAPLFPHQSCKLLAVRIKQKDVKVGRRSKHLVSHLIFFLWQAQWWNFSIFLLFRVKSWKQLSCQLYPQNFQQTSHNFFSRPIFRHKRFVWCFLSSTVPNQHEKHFEWICFCVQAPTRLRSFILRLKKVWKISSYLDLLVLYQILLQPKFET